MRLPVTKRMLGDRMASRTVRMQDRELVFGVMACNMHGLTVFMAWFLQSLFNQTCSVLSIICSKQLCYGLFRINSQNGSIAKRDTIQEKGKNWK